MANAMILPDLRERRLGWRYLLFQIVFLSWVIGRLLYFLQIPTSGVGINLLYFSVNFAVAILGFLGFWKKTLSGLGRNIPRILFCALIGFVVFQALSAAMGFLTLSIDPEFANINDQSIVALSRENIGVMAVAAVILIPVAEEVFYRGCVFGSLLGRSPVAAYAVSAVVFSIIHIDSYIGSVPPLTLLLCFLQYLPAGLCLAAAYQLSGSILAPILIHSAFNAIGILTMR